MPRLFTLAAILFCLVAVTYAEKRADNPDKAKLVADYESVGIVVVRHSFFNAAKDALAAEKDYKAPKEILADRLLITKDGVMSFLEAPQNKKLLEKIEPGSAVKVKGKIYRPGSLLLLDEATAQTEKPDIDTTRFSNAAGAKTSFAGANQCQCALDLAGLPTSCKLGHLHHLKVGEVLYHYLPIGTGAKALMGEKSHNTNVTVEALVLPGNQLLVTSIKKD